MKRIITLTTVFWVTCATVVAQHVIYMNGVDSVKIGKSTLADVQKAFPGVKVEQHFEGGDTVVESIHWMDGGNDSYRKRYCPRRRTSEATDDALGVTFYFGYNDTLGSVKIWGSSFITEKGIIPQKSTFGGIDSAYGKQDWYSTYEHNLKKYVWVKNVFKGGTGYMFYSSEKAKKGSKTGDLTAKVAYIVVEYGD